MFLCSKASSGFPLHFELIKSLQDPQTLAPLPHLFNLLFSTPHPAQAHSAATSLTVLLFAKMPASGRLHRLFHSLFQGALPQAPPPTHPSHLFQMPSSERWSLSPCVTSLPLSLPHHICLGTFCHLIHSIFFYSCWFPAVSSHLTRSLEHSRGLQDGPEWPRPCVVLSKSGQVLGDQYNTRR